MALTLVACAGRKNTAQTPALGADGCAVGTDLAEGLAALEMAGVTRHFIVRLPDGYSKARRWPLVLALHPNGNSGLRYWDAVDGERPLRPLLRDKAVLVLPEARPKDKGWDWRGDLPADLAYFEALIARVKSGLCIDTARIFSMGFSGGGSFSSVLGCHRRDIRAIAIGGAVAYFKPEDCVGHPPAWITIGQGELVPARESLRDFWRDREGCSATTSPVAPPPCVAYACPSQTPVHYCLHPAGHKWPDFGVQAAWAFFSRF